MHARRIGMLLLAAAMALLCGWLVLVARERHTPAREAASDAPAPPEAAAPSSPPRSDASVTGRVRLGPDGRWGAGIGVRVAGERVVADANGRFSAGVVPGSGVTVIAAPAGHERTALRVEPLAAGEARDVGVLWLQRAGTLRVRVIDRAGAPVAAAAVIAGASGWQSGQQTNTRTFERVTDDAGRAEIAGIAGAVWRVFAFRAGHGSAWQTVTLAGERREIVLTLGAERTLHGRVVDDTGAPLPGVIVLARQGPFTWKSFPDRPVCTEVAADAEGRYRLRGLAASETHLLVVRCAGRPVSIATVDSAAIDRFDLVVPRVGTLFGTVRDEAGAPIAGARVGASCGEAHAVATSGPDGAFLIDDLLSGSRGSASASKRGFVFDYDAPPFRLVPGGRVRRDLTLRRGVMLRGEVSDERGPLPGARVFARSASGAENVFADAHGRFALRVGPAGPILVVAEMPGFHLPGAPLDRKAAWEAGAPDEFFVTDRETPVRLRLEPGVVVTGRVTDGAGEPLADAALSAQRITRNGNAIHGYYSRHAASDADGRFRFVLAPGGTFLVHVTRSGTRYGAGKEIVAAAGLELALVDAARPLVRLTGRVTDARGGPAAGIAVHCGERTTWTDAEGGYSFDGLTPVGGRLGVIAGNRSNPLGHATVAVSADAAVADLRLRAPRPLRGNVVDPAGRPVAGARVALLRSERTRGEPVGRITGADGVFEFDDVRPWDRVRAAAPGYVATTVGVRAPRIVLRPAFDIAGTVRTSRGHPVEGAVVSVAHGPQSATDARGRFRLRGVAGGEYSVAVEGARALPPIASMRSEPVAAGRSDVELTATEAGTITGRVVGTFGKRLRVAVGEHAEAELDRQGRFRLEGVPLGSHRVEVRKRIDGPESDATYVLAALPDIATGSSGIRFDIDAGGAIAGTLREVEDGYVMAYPRGKPGGAKHAAAASAQVGAAGRFELTGLVPGEYSLWAVVEKDDGYAWIDLKSGARTGARAVVLRTGR